MKQLLLVEDDMSLGETLRERLVKEGYAVEKAESAADAIEFVKAKNFDLFILDVGLPDGMGFDLAKKIRALSSSPFIFVTAQSDAESRLVGYEVGAEEYIPKPFHLKELLMRVRHVLDNHAAKDHLSVNDVVIEFAAQRISYADGRHEAVPLKEMEILKLLISQAPRVLSRDEILNRVWGEDKFPTNRTVDNAILRLRQLLGESAGRSIRSVRGVGYQWEVTNE